MYASQQKIKDTIDYIEKNITTNLDCNILAEITGLSIYEFKRIFSFAVGCPVSEYIKRRRLSLAALEIMENTHIDIISLSKKYGYSNQSEFRNDFHEYHNMAYSEFVKRKNDITLFTVPKFETKISQSECIFLNIKKDSSFYIQGICSVSDITDNYCKNVWETFYKSEYYKKFNSDKIYAAYKNSGKNVLCIIGERASQPDISQFEEIPETLWACFKENTINDEHINKEYSKILCNWLPSANLNRNNAIPILEVYPFNMPNEKFEWEIRIPIL